MKSALGIILSFTGTMLFAMDVKEKQIEKHSARIPAISIGSRRAPSQTPASAALLEEPRDTQMREPQAAVSQQRLGVLMSRMYEQPLANSAHDELERRSGETRPIASRSTGTSLQVMNPEGAEHVEDNLTPLSTRYDFEISLGSSISSTILSKLNRRQLKRAERGSELIAQFRQAQLEKQSSGDPAQPLGAKASLMDESKKKPLPQTEEESHSILSRAGVAEKATAALGDPAQRATFPLDPVKKKQSERASESGRFIGLSRRSPAAAAAPEEAAHSMRRARNETGKPRTRDHSNARWGAHETSLTSNDSESSMQSAAVHEGFSRNAAALLSPRHERQGRGLADGPQMLSSREKALASAAQQSEFSITSSLVVNGQNVPTKCCLSDFDKRLLVERDGRLSLIDTSDPEKIHTVNLWSDPSKRRSINSIDFDGRIAVAGMSDGSVELWTVGQDLNITHYVLSKNFGGSILSVALQCTGEKEMSASVKKETKRTYRVLASAADGTNRHFVFSHVGNGIKLVPVGEWKDRPVTQSLLANRFSSDGFTSCLTVSSEGEPIFWQLRYVLKRLMQKVGTLEAYGSIFEAEKGYVRYFDTISNPDPNRSIEKSSVLVAASPSLQQITIAKNESLIFWWPGCGWGPLLDSSDKIVISALAMSDRTIVAGSINGEVLAFNYDPDPIKIDFSNLDDLFVIERLSGSVTNLAISEDSRWLAIATDNQELYLCNFINKDEWRTLPLPVSTSEVTSLSIRLLPECGKVRVGVISKDGSVVSHDINASARGVSS